MDKRVLKERMRQKQRQLRRRKIMRLAAMGAGGVLLLVFVLKGILGPLAGKISGGKESPAAVEAQASAQEQPQQADTLEAVRMPIRGAKDTAKASIKSVGWQEDELGRWYQCPDGSYYASGFRDIDGQTYYFDDAGYLQSGWVTVDNMDYWFNEDGTLDSNKQRPMVALTFDDGPGPRTMELLECLEANASKATFFMQGVNIERYADTGAVEKMVELGCELGNHSYSHQNMREISGEQVASQFSQVDDLLRAQVGQETTVVRYPYGSYDENVLNIVAKPSFMWNMDTLDWKTHNAENTYNLVMDNVSDGDVILLHDIHTESIDAALKLVPALVEEGYKLVTVSEMAAAKGITLQDGGVYFDFLPETVQELKATQGYTDNTEGEFIDNYSGGDVSAGEFENSAGGFEGEDVEE